MNQRKAGVVLSYITLGTQSLIALIYVPMLLHYLTQVQYGIYQLMGSLVAYLSIMDFGLSNTTTRYVSRALALKDVQQVKKVIATSHTIYAAIAFILCLVGAVFYFCIDPIYSHSLSIEELHSAKQIYLLMLVNVVLAVESNILTSVINAHERFVFIQSVNLLKLLIQPLLVWAILVWKANAFNVVVAQTVCLWSGILINYYYCTRKLSVSFPFQFSKTPLFKELTGFSIFVFLHVLMDQVYYRSGQLILGAVSGANAVALYAIAIQLVTFTTTIPANMSSIFLPKLSASVATQKGLDETNELFCKLGRLQFMLVMLLVMGFVFLGKTFLSLWLGAGYEKVYGVVLVIMSGYVLDVSQHVGISALQAMKKHAFRAYVYVGMAVLNIALAIPLSKHLGEIGCAISTAFCLFLGSGLLMNWYYHKVGIDIKRFFINIGKLSLPVVLAIVMIQLIFTCLPLQTDLFNFIWHGLLLTFIYALVMWCLACNAYERELVLQPCRRIGGYLTHLFLSKKTVQ